MNVSQQLSSSDSEDSVVSTRQKDSSKPCTSKESLKRDNVKKLIEHNYQVATIELEDEDDDDVRSQYSTKSNSKSLRNSQNKPTTSSISINRVQKEPEINEPPLSLEKIIELGKLFGAEFANNLLKLETKKQEVRKLELEANLSGAIEDFSPEISSSQEEKQNGKPSKRIRRDSPKTAEKPEIEIEVIVLSDDDEDNDVKNEKCANREILVKKEMKCEPENQEEYIQRRKTLRQSLKEFNYADFVVLGDDTDEEEEDQVEQDIDENDMLNNNVQTISTLIICTKDGIEKPLKNAKKFTTEEIDAINGKMQDDLIGENQLETRNE